MNYKNKRNLNLAICCLMTAICLSFTGCKNGLFKKGPSATPTLSPYALLQNDDGIGIDVAKELAVAYAGLSASDVIYTKADASYVRGVVMYKVNFTTDTHQYLCELAPVDGSIKKYSMEPLAAAEPDYGTGTEPLTLEEAKNISLVHAGLPASDVTFTKEKLDYNDGMVEYEIGFTTNTGKYEYDINPDNGLILGYSMKPLPITEPEPPASVITANDARAAALSHAGLTASDVIFGRTESDYHNHKPEYTIKFTTNTGRYRYRISADTGKVLEYSMNPVTPEASASLSGTVTLDFAKNTALSHAGLNASEVTFVKAEPEYDDGTPEYEIEFITNAGKYEYDISADTGLILKYSIKSTQTAVTHSKKLTTEDAKKAALSHAGFAASEVTFTETELEYDDGKATYEIEFVTETAGYEYTIDAGNGTVLEYSMELLETALSGSRPHTIPEEDAKKAALSHAGLPASKVTFTKVKLEQEDGRAEYEIAFTTDAGRYQYDINAESGTVLSYSIKLEPVTSSGQAPAITTDRAKAAALSHAGLSTSEVRFTKTELDYDDGRAEYEIEFVTDICEYDYTINADTGRILEYSIELIKRAVQGLQIHAITMDEAQNAALSHAELTASEVTFTKSEAVYDNGRAEYKIEFVTENCEYKYRICADTGEVLACSAEVTKSTGLRKKTITAEEAKEIALSYANLTAPEVEFVTELFTFHAGKSTYRFEFYLGRKEHDITIDAVTGRIITAEIDP